MKYYFIFCLYLIFILPLSAQERKERPQFKLGGALRFNPKSKEEKEREELQTKNCLIFKKLLFS